MLHQYASTSCSRERICRFTDSLSSTYSPNQ
ncbi:hypothetical protein F442_16450 [Phytophthora nicotianae P10297]|uniref:Uncharacterized protein n=1 Tax=Phytophthora nicotianae P10297 TaxID=1317064 RepID=W2YKX6_PHYNI|nr:hypothetical protein F442_16450 [Phytophthora nicotianae P10297]